MTIACPAQGFPFTAFIELWLKSYGVDSLSVKQLVHFHGSFVETVLIVHSHVSGGNYDVAGELPNVKLMDSLNTLNLKKLKTSQQH